MWMFAMWMACSGGTDGSVDGTDTGPTTPPLVEFEGCEGATFYASDEDPAQPGPWPVGARTVTVPRSDGGTLTVEIWYPAQLGSDEGLPPEVYPVEYALPESQQDLIGPELSPIHTCDCVRDLPLDTEHGPYPVVVFIHGTASWRSQSLSLTALWASRGFVVVSADHPGLWLADQLALLCPDSPTGERDIGGDVDTVRAALPDVDFLDGYLDLERLAVTGHSAGGSATAAYADRASVRLAMPLASATPVQPGPDLESVVFMGALSDDLVSFDATVKAYEASEGPRRVVGVSNAGHLLFSDICEIRNEAGDNILKIAQDVGVCGTSFAGVLFDCDPTFLDAAVGGAIVGHTTVSALEETLMCQDRSEAWARLDDYTEVDTNDFTDSR
ncbi:MAG: alpha/beta hydrolase [Myxococcales bacterium]|nr:alpha/beta hydrolase [Myxococcales bacterium]